MEAGYCTLREGNNDTSPNYGIYGVLTVGATLYVHTGAFIFSSGREELVREKASPDDFLVLF